MHLVDHSVLHGLSVNIEAPHQSVVLQATEEVLVVDLDFPLLQVNFRCPDALVLVGNLISMRIQLAVWTDDSVAVEVVVRRVVAVVVATVGVVYLVQLGVGGELVNLQAHRLHGFAVQSLVYKVPDVSALELGIFADKVPILFETTTRVAHRVVIFALDERLLVFVVLGVGLRTPRGVVHRAEDVGVATISASLLPLAGA